MKIVLAGCPQISVAAFEEVIKNFDVVVVITQPDSRQGRGMKVKQTIVADLADKYNIKVFKPVKISEIYNELKNISFDLMLTFAFGQWIPSNILTIGKFKPMNIHGSLLPKYRGAAPIHHAILNGEEEIGITLMEMVKEMDAGDMYFKASKVISPSTTTGEAFSIISKLAAENITGWLKKIASNEIAPKSQSLHFSIAPKILKGDSLINLSMKKDEAFRKIKGLSPFPCAYILINNKRMKIFDVSEIETEKSIELIFSDGSLYASDYQLESKKRISP